MRRTIVVATLVIGCGSNDAAPIDAPADASVAADAGLCWPDLARTPKGVASVGTGRDGFQPMPEDLPLEYGIQDGFMLIAQVKMSGFEPGNPKDAYDPANLRTRLRAFFDETNIPLNIYAHCPHRYPYVSAGGSDYELYEEIPLVFETCWRSNHLIDQRIRVELELMDNQGGFTSDVKVVTARAPLEPYSVEEGPGCMH